MLLPLLLACNGSPDTGDSADSGNGGDSGDTGDTADTGEVLPVNLADLVGGTPASVTSCGWAYVAARYAEATFVVRVSLPNADDEEPVDQNYTLPLGSADRIEIGTGTGTGTLNAWDCSDVMESEDGVRLWTASAATVSVDATYVRDAPEWTCDGEGPNPVYDATITLSDVLFTDENGVAGVLAEWTVSTPIGMYYCGG